MINYLLVPIRVNALFLNESKVVTEASVDFTRIPYSDNERDVNPDIAYISEEIVSQPFQNQNLVLNAGVHLHWFLPDALTKGMVESGKTTFPRVPNRWLITRTQPEEIRQWVVESDYLHPNGEGDDSIVFPFAERISSIPTRRFGRNMSLDDWLNPKNTSQNEYLDGLTALGYGTPAFASFYPNCHSVFGFYDSDIPGTNAPTYSVIGWYSNYLQDDLIKNYPSNLIETGNKNEFFCYPNLKWKAGSDGLKESPQRMFCYGAVTSQGPVESTERKKIAIANSGVEALSAYLADEIGGDQKATIEEQLEFLSIQPKLANSRLDLDGKFRENRHERSFNAIVGGTHWTIKSKGKEVDPSRQDNKPIVELPSDCAGQLNQVNQLQREYDRAMQEITDLRRQLFSDWYKYMLCAYPPEGAFDDYPDIDEVKFFIQTEIKALEHKLDQTGTLILNFKKGLPDRTLESASGRGSISEKPAEASDLTQAINELLQKIKDHKDQNEELNAEPYDLTLTPSSRYWQPKEPVVLIEGEVEPAFIEERTEYLDCYVVSGNSNDDSITKIVENVRTTGEGHPKDPAFRKQKPWPIFLEWEVEFFPIEGGNVFPTQDYPEDFITSKFSLDKEAIELQTNVEKVNSAQVYSGRSILTPHAGIQVQQKISKYLQILDDRGGLKKLLDALLPDASLTDDEFWNWYNKKPSYPDGTGDKDKAFQNWLIENICGISSWYGDRPSAAQEKIPNPIFTFLSAFDILKHKVFLSQALSGFNDALLMHKQTMQLPIADPLGFQEYQDFAGQINAAIAGESKSAPQPLDDFNPIRTGRMKILHLRIIDTFGQVQELQFDQVIASETMRSEDGIVLPPRLVQPASLNFRWLDASNNAGKNQETNTHPATHPICGWLLPNMLDNSLMVYEQTGVALGEINEKGWEAAPGTANTVDGIANPALKELVEHIESNIDKLNDFIDVLENALENISPDHASEDIGMALLIGRPIAVVRASLKLEILGRPAVHQGWNVFRQDLGRATRDTNAFEKVKFPIRLGQEKYLSDGLIGYWIEAQGAISSDFYTPQSNSKIEMSLDDPAKTLLLLMDPRGNLHATSGILPVKEIGIPPEQYVDLLRNLEVTFLTAPILTNQTVEKSPTPAATPPNGEAAPASAPESPTGVNLPVPSEPGYGWTWLEEQGNTWQEKVIHLPNPQEAFSAPQEIREGWLKLKPGENLPTSPETSKGESK